MKTIKLYSQAPISCVVRESAYIKFYSISGAYPRLVCEWGGGSMSVLIEQIKLADFLLEHLDVS